MVSPCLLVPLHHNMSSLTTEAISSHVPQLNSKDYIDRGWDSVCSYVCILIMCIHYHFEHNVDWINSDG